MTIVDDNRNGPAVNAPARRFIPRGDTPAPTGIVLQTQDDAPAGLLEPWAAKHGLGLEIVRVDDRRRLPDPARYAFAVALGSSASVAAREHAWIEREIEWLAEADAAGVPVLGICFGAHALAAAFDARVYRLDESEIGWIAVESNDPEHVPAGPWLSWHHDGFELPPDSVELARNAFGVQAFGKDAHLGVQFHPEATPDIAVAWDVDGSHRLAAGPAQAAMAAGSRLFDDFAVRAGFLLATAQ